MLALERTLEGHPFIEGLDPRHHDAMIECASDVQFAAGQLIFREGEEASHLFLIQDGKVALEVFRLDPGPIVIQTLVAGDVLGWSWLVPPYRWRFDARALEHTRTLAFDGPCLRAMCEESPAFGYELLKRLFGILEQRLQATKVQLRF